MKTAHLGQWLVGNKDPGRLQCSGGNAVHRTALKWVFASLTCSPILSTQYHKDLSESSCHDSLFPSDSGYKEAHRHQALILPCARSLFLPPVSHQLRFLNSTTGINSRKGYEQHLSPHPPQVNLLPASEPPTCSSPLTVSLVLWFHIQAGSVPTPESQ